MIKSEKILVLDASIAVAWFFSDEPLHSAALEVRHTIRESPAHFAVPTLIHSEMIHALTRKSGCNRLFVRSALDLFLRLGIPSFSLSSRALQYACDWACRGMSGYDATYAALAEDIGCKWLTGDAKAAKILGGSRVVLLEPAGQPMPGS